MKTNLLRLVVVLFFSVLFLDNCADSSIDASSTTATLSSGSFPQRLTISGNKIVDESGTQVILRGLNAQDPIWQSQCSDTSLMPWQEAQFKTMSQWGANVVRLPVHPASWQEWGETISFQIMDQFIAWSKKYKMYVIIDFHSIGFPPTGTYLTNTDNCFSVNSGRIYDTTESQMKDFWQKVALRYKDEKGVAFYELFNEPNNSTASGGTGLGVKSDWTDFKTFIEKIVSTIRTVDSTKPLMVGGLYFAYDLSFAQKDPIADKSIIYATHIYPGNDWSVKWQSAFIDLSATYPVFATEIGFQNSAINGHFDSNMAESKCGSDCGSQTYRNAVIQSLENNKIGWTVWSFTTSWDPLLLSDKGYTPTEAGIFFKTTLLSKNR